MFFSQLRYFNIKILSLAACCIAAPLRAEFNPPTFMEAIRNNKLYEAQTIIAADNNEGQKYLRQYAEIFFPAIARIGTPEALNLIADIIGKDRLQPALDHALVAAFDNLKFVILIEPLLKLGANPSARALGQTALTKAAATYIRRGKQRDLEAIRLLIKAGANLDAAEDSGMTPLMWACSTDNALLAELLLNAGANPTIQTKEGRSAVTLAGPECTKLLPQKIQTPSTDQVLNELMLHAMYQAVITNDVKQFMNLLVDGVPVDSVMDNTGQNFLMQVKDSAMFLTLLEHGANPNWVDIHGWTVLHRLVTCPHTVNLIKILLHAGATIHNRIDNGQDALLLSHLLFVEKLDAAGGKEILRLLVQEGADINNADRDGETLLHLAAYNNTAGLAKIALELGANPNQPNQRGETPLSLAKRLNAQDVLKILLSSSAPLFN
jgi:serine/threonine-protein phosphatase 6 regulatory ankyrin repeat subunit A